MIKLRGVNKYFNKGKRNEIHVINDTTLNLGTKGLVALLGPSGCGKTTMLNAIGGLDKRRRYLRRRSEDNRQEYVKSRRDKKSQYRIYISGL